MGEGKQDPAHDAGTINGNGVQPTKPMGFWKEFVRVQSDKVILFLLIIFLHYTHAPENLQATAVGGLIVLIQGQRFKIG